MVTVIVRLSGAGPGSYVDFAMFTIHVATRGSAGCAFTHSPQSTVAITTNGSGNERIRISFTEVDNGSGTVRRPPQPRRRRLETAPQSSGPLSAASIAAKPDRTSGHASVRA